MRALVTGATGFMGSHLVAELRRRGWPVVCVVRRSVTAADPEIACVRGDLSDPESLRYSAEDVGPIDVVFHLAARTPYAGDPNSTCDFVKDNVLGSTALLESFLDLEAAAFVYASGISVIGRPAELPVAEDHPTKPADAYVVSKLAAELVCEQTRLDRSACVVSLRITSPYGPGMSETTVLPRFVKLALASEDISLYGSGARTQNFVHVGDIVRACLLAAEGDEGGVFNVAGPDQTSMRDLARAVVRLAPGCRSEVRFADKPDPQEEYRWDVDLAKSRRTLGYEPEVSFEDGLRDYIDFLASGRPLPRWWDE